MAVSACFGASLMTMLLGPGLSLSYILIDRYPDPYYYSLKWSFDLGFAFLGLSLISSLVVIPLNKFTAPRPYGIYLILVYVAFAIISVLDELGVITL
jgi:sodium/potassium/calcium exchanger 6